MSKKDLMILVGCGAIGAAIGVVTGGIGIAAMGSAIGVSGPVAGGTLGSGAGLFGIITKKLFKK